MASDALGTQKNIHQCKHSNVCTLLSENVFRQRGAAESVKECPRNELEENMADGTDDVICATISCFWL